MILRKVEEKGRFDNADLDAAVAAAGNVSEEEDLALRMIFVDASDIEHGAEDLPWRRFLNHLELEKGCRHTAQVSMIRSGVGRGISGGAMGAATAAAFAPMVGTTVEQWAMATLASLLGAYVGFRTGSYCDYGVKN